MTSTKEKIIHADIFYNLSKGNDRVLYNTIKGELSAEEYNDSATLKILIDKLKNVLDIEVARKIELSQSTYDVDKLREELKSLKIRSKSSDKINSDNVLLQRINEQLKEEVDKLRMSNQEKDIEIQELRDQVTQQAQRWLVPNF